MSKLIISFKLEAYHSVTCIDIGNNNDYVA